LKDAQASTIRLQDYRPPAYLIDNTFLTFELHEDFTLVKSRLSMRRDPEVNKEPLILHGEALELLGLCIDGEALPADRYTVDEACLIIDTVPDAFTLECRTRINPRDNTCLKGLYQSGGMFCTQCEAEGFRRITYYLDRPDVMAVFTVRVEADRVSCPVLLSNGNRIDAGIDGDNAERHWAVWEDPFPKPSYLFALVAGDLRCVEDQFITRSERAISLRMYVEEKDTVKCGHALASLKKAMRWDEEVYGREYDLDSYMIVAVDDFNYGAMENKGLNIFNTKYVLADPRTATDAAYQQIEGVVAHEYFHNWSGNRVTCRDWFQLSLKENFTVFREQTFSADMGSETVKRIADVTQLRTVQFPEDAGPLAHPVQPDAYMEISNFYTATVYNKGAEVVRMIRSILGEGTFRRGCDLYFERHDGCAVTIEEFLRAMEDAGGTDLTQFRRWYDQAGTPEVRVEGIYHPDNKTYTLNVKQSCPPTPGQSGKQPFHIPMNVGLLDSEGCELAARVLAVTEPAQQFVFENIPCQPVPSVLRGFSAPVKLQIDYTRDELMFLMSHDNDGFNRWEAGQRLAISVIRENIENYRGGGAFATDSRLLQAYETVLQNSLVDPAADKAMLARLLTLPGEDYLVELFEPADIEAIHAARRSVFRDLGRQLAPLWAEVFHTNRGDKAYQFTASEVARRSLKNLCLEYLMECDDTAWLRECERQFRDADNMTDVSAALKGLVHSGKADAVPAKVKALATFYEQWQQEPLMIDQWFTIQATSPLPETFEQVRELAGHPAFDIRNPNRVRALIGAFCSQNAIGFHRADGDGYRFLADQIIELNRLNPQIAARLLGPLTRWKKRDAQRQLLMKQQLRRIHDTGGLSRGVLEVVSKSLEV
jgi:aminopeptidase N